jgi:hypothetical protein
MDSTSLHLESLWNDLLSRQPERIWEAFNSLDAANKQIVLAHLQNMVSESGWQAEQRVSAKAALQALQHLTNQEK